MLLFNYAASKMTEIITANGVNQLTETFSSARPWPLWHGLISKDQSLILCRMVIYLIAKINHVLLTRLLDFFLAGMHV